jgi:hypothetical protein
MNESANWTCHLLGCNGVLVDGLKINNSVRANRDGLDIDGCENVMISNCRISSMDDAIVLRSTGPALCRNINIVNCNVSSHASGIKMGTETTGGFENITISNCIIRNIPVYSGIALMIVDGGTMRNISVNNIVMDSVNVPFMIRLGNRARPYKEGLTTPGTGSIENIRISQVSVTNAGLTSHITGLHSKALRNISFRSIDISYNKEFQGKVLAYNKVPLKEADYPSGQLYGKNLPASAFYFRNIDGLTLDDIQVRFLEKDPRIPFVFDRVNDLRILYSRAKTKSMAPLLYLRNVKHALIENCSNYMGSSFLAVMETGNCSDIRVEPDKLAENQKAVNSSTALKDKSFENISGYSNHTFPEGPVIEGLTCYALIDGPLSVKLKTIPGKAIKIQFLSQAPLQTETILVTINGKEYPLVIPNKKWGWNMINFPQIYSKENVKLKIRIRDSGSLIYLSKIALIPVSVTD